MEVAGEPPGKKADRAGEAQQLGRMIYAFNVIERRSGILSWPVTLYCLMTMATQFMNQINDLSRDAKISLTHSFHQDLAASKGRTSEGGCMGWTEPSQNILVLLFSLCFLTTWPRSCSFSSPPCTGTPLVCLLVDISIPSCMR